MLKLVYDAFKAHGLEDDQLFWWDKVGDEPKDDVRGTPEPWVRITVRHNTGRQGALGTTGGKRCFDREGVVFVEIFSPFGTGLSIGDDLYKVAADALEGRETTSGIWFRNVRLNEVGQDGAWFKSNVLADFIYREVK
jgi:hypothetical protein